VTIHLLSKDKVVENIDRIKSYLDISSVFKI